MTTSYHELRKQLIAESTRAFNARGKDVVRCDGCQLRVDVCICGMGQTLAEGVGLGCDLVLLMHKKEFYKPTNSGRLLVDLFPDNSHVFCWSRLEPQAELLALLEDPQRQCCILFPGDDDDPRVSYQWPQAIGQEPEAKRPTLIILDGTWKQARRMFNLSPYLAGLPVISVEHKLTSSYFTRQAAHWHYLSTAESVGLALQQLNSPAASKAVLAYFAEFNRRYAAIRQNTFFSE
ncbi:MAG: DTW domain-containing protein [Cellvibrionaceae bacterium]